MAVVLIVILASAAIPLSVAWRSNQRTTLRHAIGWAWLAWLAWLMSAIWPQTLTNYAALTLTSAAGVAVLGARRPGQAAWDFIVASLLVVLWLGWAEGLLTNSDLKLGPFRLTFLVFLLVVTVLNYLLTRLGFGSLCLAVGLTQAIVDLTNNRTGEISLAVLPIAIAPWAAWFGLKIMPWQGSESDRSWRLFRDRFGVVWAERLRDQFNRAAKNSGWPVELGWSGLRTQEEKIRTEWVDALSALQKRFRLDGLQ